MEEFLLVAPCLLLTCSHGHKELWSAGGHWQPELPVWPVTSAASWIFLCLCLSCLLDRAGCGYSGQHDLNEPLLRGQRAWDWVTPLPQHTGPGTTDQSPIQDSFCAQALSPQQGCCYWTQIYFIKKINIQEVWLLGECTILWVLTHVYIQRSQDAELVITPETPWCWSFTGIPFLHPCSWHPQTVLCHCNFIILRMSYEWNHRVCNLWDWFCLLDIIPLRFIQVVCISNVCPLLLSSIPFYGCTRVCLSIQPLKSIGLFPVVSDYEWNGYKHSHIGLVILKRFCFKIVLLRRFLSVYYCFLLRF